MYIPLIHKCVTNTVGCGTSHKYTNIYSFYSVKYILQNSIIDHLYIQKIHFYSPVTIFICLPIYFLQDFTFSALLKLFLFYSLWSMNGHSRIQLVLLLYRFVLIMSVLYIFL